MLRLTRTLPGGPLEAGPDETTWVWSDLHLGHDPSIRAFRRPFLHVRQMDDVMFRTWKLSVEDDHTIICLGDATIGTLHGHRLRGLRDAPGHKHLVLGNHDLNPLEDRGGWFRRRRRHDDLRAGVSAAAAHSRPAAEGADRDGQRPRALPRQVLAGPAHPHQRERRADGVLSAAPEPRAHAGQNPGHGPGCGRRNDRGATARGRRAMSDGRAGVWSGGYRRFRPAPEPPSLRVVSRSANRR